MGPVIHQLARWSMASWYPARAEGRTMVGGPLPVWVRALPRVSKWEPPLTLVSVSERVSEQQPGSEPES